VKAVRRLPVLTGIVALATVVLLAWLFLNTPSEIPRQPADKPAAPVSQPPSPSPTPTASERLLEGYADPATPPIEDLKKLHRVITGYFSVVKDASRFPIGGSADLAAALRGENPNREVFVPAGHPVFSKDGLLVDRWGSPLVVHPEAWKQLELRSAGPDRQPYTGDDLLLAPAGFQKTLPNQ
jgi:hypothetical protein